MTRSFESGLFSESVDLVLRTVLKDSFTNQTPAVLRDLLTAFNRLLEGSE